MAYFRKLKSGETKLVFTAKDRQKQLLRDMAKRFETPHGHLWQYNRHNRNYNVSNTLKFVYQINGRETIVSWIEDKEQLIHETREVIAATLLWQHKGEYSPKASPSGDVDYVRGILHGIQEDLRYFKQVLYAIDNGRM
jgi:hypothetical protein